MILFSKRALGADAVPPATPRARQRPDRVPSIPAAIGCLAVAVAVVGASGLGCGKKTDGASGTPEAVASTAPSSSASGEPKGPQVLVDNIKLSSVSDPTVQVGDRLYFIAGQDVASVKSSGEGLTFPFKRDTTVPLESGLALSANGTAAYCACGGKLVQFGPDGVSKAVGEISIGIGGTNFVSTSKYFYWVGLEEVFSKSVARKVTLPTLRRVAIDGGKPELISTADDYDLMFNALDVVADDSKVVLGAYKWGGITALDMTTAAKPKATKVTSATAEIVRRLNVAAGKAFWLDRAAGTVLVSTLATDTTEKLSGGWKEPDSLFVDAKYVYWTSADQVLRILQTGGKVETLAESRRDPKGLIVDDNYIYWLEPGTEKNGYSDGRLVRMKKT